MGGFFEQKSHHRMRMRIPPGDDAAHTRRELSIYYGYHADTSVAAIEMCTRLIHAYTAQMGEGGCTWRGEMENRVSAQ